MPHDDIRAIHSSDADYPLRLAEIHNPPDILFVRGALPDDARPHIAIVGTRRPTPYGIYMAEMLSFELARLGVVVVSGLALGIDGKVHESALRAGGTTFAILGSGVDEHTVYPTSHRGLADKIVASGGALASEYPAGFKPTQYSFPARNRIIAGITHGTLVIEAPEKSGALITAYSALENGREVMAVPHPTTSLYGRGCNNLIKRGASIITGVEDVLELFHLTAIQDTPTPVLSLSETEQIVLTELTIMPRTIDELTTLTHLSNTLLLSALTTLELSGLITKLDAVHYAPTKQRK